MNKENIKTLFPPQPEEPLPSDCCGSGCSPCVFDIYREQMVEWEKQCSDIISNGENCLDTNVTDLSMSPLSQTVFTPFVLISLQQHTHDTFVYLFQAVRDSELVHVRYPLGIRPGQHLIMRCSEEIVLTRAYTPISDKKCSNIGQFETLIKLYDNGRMSKYIRTLKQNDIVKWRGPCGNFQYVPNGHKHLLMICAGTGIAPMYSISKSIVENDSDDTIVRLLFACKDFEDILLRNELQKLTLYWNFSAEIFLSRARLPIENQSRYGESVRKGKIVKEVIDKELANKELKQVRVLICGTKSFNKDMLNYVKKFGIPDDNVHLF
ncbi:NADH-cytochrome b5 reductase-like [Periplaneta americana]|uniref:NADH-cytochrome b5 reductase-like n=1 Tax=Periplaneta americana TaxID=6978 RepID=UPI0037E94999